MGKGKFKYLYFVSYAFFSNRQYGFGNMQISSTGKYSDIKHLKDAKEIIDDMNRDRFGNKIDSVVLYFKLLKKPKRRVK